MKSLVFENSIHFATPRQFFNDITIEILSKELSDFLQQTIILKSLKCILYNNTYIFV